MRIDEVGINLFSPLLFTDYHTLQGARMCPVRVKGGEERGVGVLGVSESC